MKTSLGITSILGLLASSVVTPAHADVIYQISPYYSTLGSTQAPLKTIRARLPELKDLGIDVVYLQPLTPSAEPGQGYDTIDHFSINPDLGTADDLRSLVHDAHALGQKVILDVALNHLSKNHPFVLDVEKNGDSSEYAGFFQTEGDDSQPFNDFVHLTTQGLGKFAYYFWDELFNLNYSSPGVRDYALNVLSYWVREYDVDGYRLDAAWGPSARWPEFYSKVSQTLRAIKPGVLLLAEDSAGYRKRYEGTNHPHLHGSGFDLAYDWDNEDPDWISKWSFEDAFAAQSPAEAAQKFTQGLKYTQSAEVGVLRYIENNDTASFNSSHSETLTRFATAIQFLLPGTPMLAYGQEVDARYKQWELPAFDPSRSMKSYNDKTWEFHQSLIQMRNASPALLHGSLELLPSPQAEIVCFQRKTESSEAIIVLDFARQTIEVDGKSIL